LTSEKNRRGGDARADETAKRRARSGETDDDDDDDACLGERDLGDCNRFCLSLGVSTFTQMLGEDTSPPPSPPSIATRRRVKSTPETSPPSLVE